VQRHVHIHSSATGWVHSGTWWWWWWGGGVYAAAASGFRALPCCGSQCTGTQGEVELAAWMSYSGACNAVRQAEPGSANIPSPPRRETRERELLTAYGQLGDANEVLNERAVAVMKRMSDKLGGRDFLQVELALSTSVS
jgi:hypothetical protein